MVLYPSRLVVLRLRQTWSCLTISYVNSWASYQIRKIAVCACAGNAGNVFPHRQFRRKPLVSDPGMHHGTCVTHVPWCMSGSLTSGGGENVPGIPGACAPAILRIWQEAHWTVCCSMDVRGGLYLENKQNRRYNLRDYYDGRNRIMCLGCCHPDCYK